MGNYSLQQLKEALKGTTCPIQKKSIILQVKALHYTINQKLKEIK